MLKVGVNADLTLFEEQLDSTAKTIWALKILDHLSWKSQHLLHFFILLICTFRILKEQLM